MLKNSKERKDIGTERFTVKSAINKVKKNAMTNVILLRNTINLTTEQKLYLAYFFGTRDGVATILDFEEDNCLQIEKR